MKVCFALFAALCLSVGTPELSAATTPSDTTILMAQPLEMNPLSPLVKSNNSFMSPWAYNTGDWIYIGQTQLWVDPYSPYYYKLLQINNDVHKYSSILELTIQGDPKYFNYQGTYRIRVDKLAGTSGRFDGMEIDCISGNPHAATFFVYNNALWISSNYVWGYIYYRTIADFHDSPMVPSPPYTPTLSKPTGVLATGYDWGLKCDFNNNAIYKLPYRDVQGSVFYNNNVGIGTNDTKGYKLAVNGDAIFTKIKVKEFGTWPDFVFEPDYKLPTLQAIEQYITTNKHLPNMPSAQTVAKEGLDLGEMNRKLLQKVEELTLYLIEGNKKNEVLENKLIEHEKKNKTLENRIAALEQKR